MRDPSKITPTIVISFLRDHIFPERGLKSVSHFSVLFVTLGAEREWWVDIDCGQTGTMINETPELRPWHHKLQWSPYNVITSSRRVICHTRAGQQMGTADCECGPTHTTTRPVSVRWKILICCMWAQAPWKMNVVLRVISVLNNTNPVVDIRNPILDLRASAQYFVTQMCPKGLFVIFLCPCKTLRRDSDLGISKIFTERHETYFYCLGAMMKNMAFAYKKNIDLFKDGVLNIQVM